ncbi:MAG: hypothetical protein NTZ87_02955 [Candidatus Nomurabacteria bacterium]|nr:hypothetical protein [Candidatus Nomurabacteria bacterium]
MKKENQNYVDGLEKESEKILSVFCSDSIDVRARVTFDSYVFEGIQVTFWQDDAPDLVERVNSMFDILFEEVIKTREVSRNKLVKS